VCFVVKFGAGGIWLSVLFCVGGIFSLFRVVFQDDVLGLVLGEVNVSCSPSGLGMFSGGCCFPFLRGRGSSSSSQRVANRLWFIVRRVFVRLERISTVLGV
jgi:hypothetical protein